MTIKNFFKRLDLGSIVSVDTGGDTNGVFTLTVTETGTETDGMGLYSYVWNSTHYTEKETET